MLIGRIEGATRVAGQAQGYLGLPLRDEMVNCTVSGMVPAMTTAWFPTPEEVERIVAGAAVHVRIQGTVPPPMDVGVGEPPG
jgi:hypothetical protein